MLESRNCFRIACHFLAELFLRAATAVSFAMLILLPSQATAESHNGIYGCAGYYSGASTSWKHLVTKMTLKVRDDFAELRGEYSFIGTDIKNPLNGLKLRNCGMMSTGELTFGVTTCGLWDADGKMVVETSGILNLTTMRLDLGGPSDDFAATFDCTLTAY
ncbi:MAG: hypothetical protein ACOH2H_07210 [Cypionkella sp.]